jgi:hypothetical protein
MSDRQREKEYMISLVKNLQDDTFNLRSIIKDDIIKKGVDSLLRISKNEFLKVKVQDSMYYYSIAYLSNEKDFKQNDFTVVQLKNAGGYRLIQKDHVADSIAVYEANNNDIKSQAKYYLDAFGLRYQYFIETFDWTVAGKFYKNFTKIPSGVPVLITQDKAKIDLYYNQCYQLGIVYQGYINMLKTHLEYLKGLMAFLKKEYNIQ